MTTLTDLTEEARDAIGVRRVFGEPYEKNGVTVIPAARVMGGAGAGEGPFVPGHEGTGTTAGSGRGFGMLGRPVGALVIQGERVRWLPAIDVNRLMLGFQVALIVGLLVYRSVAKARAKALGEAAKR
jgi:uncharacterized spore protein YtfJ